MNRKEKITFLKTLSVLDNKIDMREELLPQLDINLQNKNIDEVEQIIFDLLEGLRSNEEFLTEIIKLENMKIDELVEKINNKITNKPDNLNYINENHVYLIKLLIKHGLLDITHSKNYISKYTNLVASFNNQEIPNYWNNPTQFSNSVIEMIFTKKNLVNLFYFHLLNVYINIDSEEDFKNYVTQIQNNLKITITSYIRILQKVPRMKELLIPLSIISIFTETHNQTFKLYRIGQVNISEIFQIIFQDKNLHNKIKESLEVLKELDIIYEFLKKLKSIQINNNYITLILKIIIEQELYTNQILIDFCILFSDKIPDKYKEAIKKKSEEDKFWYESYILENLSSDNENTHNETLKFISLVDNWYENKELKEKIKEFIKDNINKIFEKENIYKENIYKVFQSFIDNSESFDLNYTTKDMGKILIDAFIEIDTEDEKLSYFYEHIDKIFKKKDIKTFISKLFEQIINNLEKLNDYQINILERSKTFLKIDKNQIEELFKRLIDIRDSENPFLLFKLTIENNKRKLNKELKNNIKEKLKDIKENVENEDIKDTIDEILKIL